MTAPAHPDRQGTREELAALLPHQPGCVYPRKQERAAVPCPCRDVIDFVERLCDQRAAEALEEAADTLAKPYDYGVRAVHVGDLLDRAAALRAKP